MRAKAMLRGGIVRDAARVLFNLCENPHKLMRA